MAILKRQVDLFERVSRAKNIIVKGLPKGTLTPKEVVSKFLAENFGLADVVVGAREVGNEFKFFKATLTTMEAKEFIMRGKFK